MPGMHGWEACVHEPFSVPGLQHTMCPLATQLPLAVNEPDACEKGIDTSLKAYKLGKRRWSYNQCQLVIQQEDGDDQLTVLEAMHHEQNGLDDAHAESGVVYLVKLSNGQRVRVHIFVVYDNAVAIEHEAKPGEDCYQWTLVGRGQCKKGCAGPILRAIQRYGRLGRRSGGPDQYLEDSPVSVSKSGRQRSKTSKAKDAAVRARRERDTELKDARYMYLSIDEASTHVGTRYFRLLTGVYTNDGQCLLGTAVSNQIRVLANNDVPTGAAFIPLVVPVAHNWEGWSAVAEEEEEEGVMEGRPCTRRHSSRMSGIGSPATPSERGSPTKQHTRSQSSSDTSHPTRLNPGLMDSPETHSHSGMTHGLSHRTSSGLDAGLLDMHHPSLGNFAAAAYHSEDLLQVRVRGAREQQLHHMHSLPPLHSHGGMSSMLPPRHSRSFSHGVRDGLASGFKEGANELPPPLIVPPAGHHAYPGSLGSSGSGSSALGHGFGSLHLASSLPSLDNSTCRWTVSPNVQTTMVRASSGSGSFKRSRSGGLASPQDSGSPFKSSARAPNSHTPSPVEAPISVATTSYGGGGSQLPSPAASMQQRQHSLTSAQQPMHAAHLAHQRLSHQELLDGRAAQRGIAASGGLPPSHVHPALGTHSQSGDVAAGHCGGGGAPHQQLVTAGAHFNTARSLPSNLHIAQEEHGDVLAVTGLSDGDLTDSPFSQTGVANLVVSTSSPALHAYSLPGGSNGMTAADLSEWLLPPPDQLRINVSAADMAAPQDGSKTVSNAGPHIGCQNPNSLYLGGRQTSLELAFADGPLGGPMRSVEGEHRCVLLGHDL